MNLATFFQTLFQSFYDVNSYRAVWTRWKGKGFRYAFWLIVLVSTVSCIKTGYRLYTLYIQLPAITIQKGIITEPSSRLDIIIKEDGPALIEVHPDQTLFQEGLQPTIANGSSACILAKNGMSVPLNETQNFQILFSKKLNLAFSQESIANYLKGPGLKWIVIYILGKLLFEWISYISTAVIFSWILKCFLRSKVEDTHSLYRLAIVAGTPITLIELFTNPSLYGLPGWLTFIIIYVIYIAFAAYAVNTIQPHISEDRIEPVLY